MSELGQSRKSRLAQVTSVSPPRTDIAQGHRHVRFVPILLKKVFCTPRTQILTAVGVHMRKLHGGIHHQTKNSPVTSVVDLRAHRLAIAASFVFRREISDFAFWDFFNSIDPKRA